jgi:predicted PurR-regulated permease PerM
VSANRSRESPRAQFIAILLGLACALYASWLLVRPFFIALAWAVVMAVLFYPVHARFEKRLGSAGWAAALSTLTVVVAILVPLGLVISAVFGEVSQIAGSLPTQLGQWLDPSHPVSGALVSWVEQFIRLDRFRNPRFLQSSIAGWRGQGSLWFVGGALAVAVNAALTIVTMFFLFKDARLVRTSVYELVPVENRRLWALFARSREVIVASVYGTVLVAIVQGVLGGLAFAVLGLPSPTMWGVVMTLVSLVPLLGPFVVWVPAAAYLAASGAFGKAIALTIWGTLVVGLADNVLRPMLVGNRAHMHGLVVFFGVLGGVEVFGPLGVVLGPVVFAVTLSLIDALKAVGAPAQVGGQAA